MTETNVTAADVFRRAAEVLRERGHAKRTLQDSQGRVCANGALEIAEDELGYPKYETCLSATLSAMTDGEWVNVADWNNAPERTQAEVEKLMLLAADRVEFGGES